MLLRFDVWSDFVCPYCFLMASSLEVLQAEYALDIHWRSFELRPADAPPLPEAMRVRIEAARPRLLTMARELYGLEINPGPFGINSRPALVGAKYAEAQGRGEPYHRAIFRAYWQEGRRIDELTELAAVAREVGLDEAGLLAALDNPEYQAEVARDALLAAQNRFNGVPATVIDGRYLVMGARPPGELREILARFVGQ